MAPYKQQHWLPCSYLQFFAIPGKETGSARTAVVTRVSADGVRQVKTETVGAKKYFYRGGNEKPEQSEKLFTMLEGPYAENIKRLKADHKLDKSTRLRILNYLISLHLRNPAYVNATKLNNFEKFQAMTEVMLNAMVGGYAVPPRPLEFDISQIVKRFEGTGIIPDPNALWASQILAEEVARIWDLQFVKSNDSRLFTTDHPVIILGELHPHIVLAPVTPELLAVGIDNRRYGFARNWLTSADEVRVQNLLYAQSQGAIFTHIEDVHEVQPWIDALKDTSDVDNATHVAETGWTPQILQTIKLEKLGFSFDFVERSGI